MIQRSSGILLHISSLPSAYGVGDLGPQAYRFADFLADSKQQLWQILPLNPTDPINGNSPYSSCSAFAGNILFISPELLYQEGWLDKEALQKVPFFPEGKVDYPSVAEYKRKLLDTAYTHFRSKGNRRDEYIKFCEGQKDWLADYALYAVINEQLSRDIWTNWPKGLRDRERKILGDFQEKFRDEIDRVKFFQFVFYDQWAKLKTYCTAKNVRLVGDMPIYVTYDSVDVWTNPGYFKLDKDRKPVFVAGVPPDYFSKTGQRWGNPVYDWQALKQSGYAWWVKRFQFNLGLFDTVRVDHFRGLVQYWEVPAAEETAVNGHWAPVPCEDFLNTMKKACGNLPIIAEDLGIITDDVRAVMKQFSLPGMKVLQFAFGENLETHPYLPHNYEHNTVVYTGTHDNNTSEGWYKFETSSHEKENVKQYLGAAFNERELAWSLIKLALNSPADWALVPMQDILGLGADARMNKPGTVQGNWAWRMLPQALTDNIKERLGAVTEQSNRGCQAILG